MHYTILLLCITSFRCISKYTKSTHIMYTKSTENSIHTRRVFYSRLQCFFVLFFFAVHQFSSSFKLFCFLCAKNYFFSSVVSLFFLLFSLILFKTHYEHTFAWFYCSLYADSWKRIYLHICTKTQSNSTIRIKFRNRNVTKYTARTKHYQESEQKKPKWERKNSMNDNKIKMICI